MKQYNFIGVDVDIMKFDEFFATCANWLKDKTARSKHVSCVNVNCAVECHLQPELRKIFQKADISGVDSMPFARWIKWVTGKDCDRLYAPDIILRLCKLAVDKKYRLYLYGGAAGVPEKMKEYLERYSPGVEIVGAYSPPFRTLSADEDREICKMINDTKPDFVIVGLGSPKQDKWIQDHLESIPGTVMIASGAAFDFFSNRIKQAPLWIQKSGFEWLFRLTQDPKRLWKRYTVYNVIFLWNFVLQITRIKRFSSNRMPQY